MKLRGRSGLAIIVKNLGFLLWVASLVWFSDALALPVPPNLKSLQTSRQLLARPSAKVPVYYTVELLDKLKVDTEARALQEEDRYAYELKLLTAARAAAADENDRNNLADTIAEVQDARMQSRNASANALALYYTAKAALGGKGAPPANCGLLRCGENAECWEADSVASCRCKRCYQGDGETCRPSSCAPTSYVARRSLIGNSDSRQIVHIHELHVAVFQKNRVAVVMRDSTDGDKGVLRIMSIGSIGANIGESQFFSVDGPAFGAKVSALDNGRLLVSYRDKNSNGEGFVVGGQADATKLSAVLRDPQPFAREQSFDVALVKLPSSRVVCLYAGTIENTTIEGSKQLFGGAMLMQILEGGLISFVGKYRFSHGQRVSQLAATLVTPTSFIVAYRAQPQFDTDAVPGQSHELSISWIGLTDGELAVSPSPLFIEPGLTEMWDRDVSLVSANLVACSYQSGSEKLTKLVIVKVDPATHQLEQVGTPHIIGQGAATHVKSVSLDAGIAGPHSFTFLQYRNQLSEAETCRVSPSGQVGKCGHAAWSRSELYAMSSARLDDGRLFVAYVDAEYAPFFEAFGTHEFLQQ